MTPDIRKTLRQVVQMAMKYYPNAHLGDNTPHEDMRLAFRIVRYRLRDGMHIQAAIGALENDVYRHVDM